MRGLVMLIVGLLAGPLHADVVVPVRTLRAATVISAQDLTILDKHIAGAATDMNQLIGQEASVTLYAGRPVFPADVQPPAIVSPNQFVSLIYVTPLLRIEVDGRALGRGSVGARIRVMNLSSRSTLFGTVQDDGTILVQN